MIGRATTFILAALATTPLGATHPIGPDDIARVADVGDPRIDPAGAWVAYTVKRTDIAADKHVTHLWMTRWDGSRTVQLTARDGESESSPRFSPDGRWIAFISGRGGEHDDDQLWLMDRAGGEGAKLPGIVGSVVDLAWSPDSKSIALIVADPDPDEKPNAAAEAVMPAPAKPDASTPPEATTPSAVATAKPATSDDKKPPKPIVIDRFRFMQDTAGYQRTQHQRLWLYDVATRTARRLTTGDNDDFLPAWSPNGKAIAFTSKRAPDADRTYDSNMYVVAVGAAPAEPRALTSYAGADQDEEWGSYPAWSPDGKRIAYLQGGPVALFSYGVRLLATVPAAGGAPTILTRTLDRNVSDPFWSKDGRSIGFTVEDDGAERLAQVAAAGGAVKQLAGDAMMTIRAPSAQAGKIAFLLGTPKGPGEVFVLDHAAPRQLSHQNDAWLKDVAVAPIVRTSFKSKDGTEVHGFMITPPNAKASTPLPTVLFNHGGPQSQFTAGGGWLQWQIFAGAGYAVVSSNPRGSTGRGEAYAKALYADWGGPAVPDALAAVDDAVAHGIADPKRLFVGGWSYGGMLTNYLIASDTRFRAAVSGASISNVLAGYGTDQYIRDYETELGQPWQHMDVWLRNSYPFYHNERIVTPTQFMVGDKDMNVPMTNSEQMYQGLKSRGIDSRLVIYPGQYHGFTRPSFLKDRMERWLSWYAGHAG